MQRFWDVKELGANLNVKEPTIRAWIFQGKIPFFRLGRLIRFSPSQIEAWLAKKASAAK